jgi:uracil-DNA glycosylase family 4
MTSRDQRDYLEILGYPAQVVAATARVIVPAATMPAASKPVSREAAPTRPQRRPLAPSAAASSASPLPSLEWQLTPHGPLDASLVFVCEAPAHARSPEGELLAKMIAAMGRNPTTVQVLEISGGDPEASSIAPLEALLAPALAQAKHVVAFGNLPARAILRSPDPMSNLRGRSHSSPFLNADARLWATYAPSLCIRNPNMKKPVWEDLQRLMQELS